MLPVGGRRHIAMGRVPSLLLTVLFCLLCIAAGLVLWTRGYFVDSVVFPLALIVLFGTRLPRVLSTLGSGLIDDSEAFGRSVRCAHCGSGRNTCNCV